MGELAPDVDMPPLLYEGNEHGAVALSDLRGKIVYLDFWASWCGPCRVSFPQLEQLRDELGDRGFEVLAVSVDELAEEALTFLAGVEVSYPVVHDLQGSSPRRYGLLGMPTGYLIDREGILRLVHQGFRKRDGEKLRVEIMHLLEE